MVARAATPFRHVRHTGVIFEQERVDNSEGLRRGEGGGEAPLAAPAALLLCQAWVPHCCCAWPPPPLASECASLPEASLDDPGLVQHFAPALVGQCACVS